MKIGLKIKYTKNLPAILPFLKILTKKLDYFELGVRPGENYQEYNQLLSDKIFATIHAPFVENNVNLVTPESNDLNHQGIELAKSAADFFLASAIIFHPGDQATENSSLENLFQLFQKYNDGRFLIENTPRIYKDTPYQKLGVSINELLLIKEKTKANFCLDFSHALLESAIEKREYYSYVEELIKKLDPHYFHLSGCNNQKTDRHWRILHPKNFIDYQKILPFLPKDALLTLETRFVDENNNFDQRIFEDIEFLKNLD